MSYCWNLLEREHWLKHGSAFTRRQLGLAFVPAPDTFSGFLFSYGLLTGGLDSSVVQHLWVTAWMTPL